MKNTLLRLLPCGKDVENSLNRNLDQKIAAYQ